MQLFLTDPPTAQAAIKSDLKHSFICELTSSLSQLPPAPRSSSSSNPSQIYTKM